MVAAIYQMIALCLGFISINFNCRENPAKSVTQMAGCSGSSAASRFSTFDIV